MMLLDYLKEKLSKDILIESESQKEDSYTVINIIEDNAEATLKELPILYKDKDYDVLAFTLDENNLKSKIKIFPIYERTFYNSSDAVLLVQPKGELEELYIFYIELKSKSKDKILEKHIFMRNLTRNILKSMYLKSKLSDSEGANSLEFPENTYEGMIVFQESISSRETRERIIRYENYGAEKYQGEFIKNAKKSVIQLNIKDGRPRNKKIYLKNFINIEGLEKRETDFNKFFDKKF